MHFGIKDLIDVLLVAFFLYQTYKIMKSSGTLAIFSGVVSFIVVWILVSQVLEMRLMGAILDKIISVGFVVLVILFQDEIRRFLLALGSHRGWKFLGNLFSKRNSDEKEGKYIAPVVVACKNMARKKTGALIVVQQDVDLSIYEHTGEMFCADPTAIEYNGRLYVFGTNSCFREAASDSTTGISFNKSTQPSKSLISKMV